MNQTVCWLCCIFAAWVMVCEVKAAPKQQTPQRIVVFGDSTTALRPDTRVYGQILADELPEQGFAVEIVNAGKGNDTSQGARERFEKDVLAVNPNVVVIQFGINDAAVDVFRKKNPAKFPRVPLPQYLQNMTLMVQTLKARKIPVILMTSNKLAWHPKVRERYGKPPYNVADPDGINAFLREYVAAVRTLAKKERVPLVDIYAAYEAVNKKRGKSHDQLLSDGVHPNDQGHRLVADLLTPELLKFHESKKSK